MKRFTQEDIFVSRLKTYPENDFWVSGSSVWYNSEVLEEASLGSGKVKSVPQGYISLYEENINRPESEYIYPYVIKNGSLMGFKNITTDDYNAFTHGDVVTGSYPLSASVTRYLYESTTRKYVTPLKNTCNHYAKLSPHFYFNTGIMGEGMVHSRDFAEVDLNLISIPSIFYGSEIKRGSVNLDFYVTGVLCGALNDEKENGELIETTGPRSGSVAGVVLYREGIIILTGSYDLDTEFVDKYGGDLIYSNPNWLYFGTGLNDSTTGAEAAGSSFNLRFDGVNYVPTLTMFAHANQGEMNFSTNPTFITKGETVVASTGSTIYKELPREIKNTAKAYFDVDAPFKKQTWISTIGIYDKDKRLIAVAKLATPIKKAEQRDLTFKMRLDF